MGKCLKDTLMLELEKPISRLNLKDELIHQLKVAWQNFINKGLPNKKDKHWYYTNLSSLYSKYGISKAKIILNEKDYHGKEILNKFLSSDVYKLNSDVHNIIFIDGNLAYFDNTNNLIISSSVRLDTESCSDALSSLNNACCTNKILISIGKDTRLNQPLVITYLHTKNVKGTVINYNLTLVLNRFSQCTVKENFISLDNIYSAGNVITKLELKEGATCVHDMISSNSSSYILTTHKVKILASRNAKYKTFQMDISPSLKHVEFDVDLYSEESTFYASGISILSNHSKLDYYYSIKHSASNTTSSIKFHTVSGKRSSMTFYPKAHIKKDLSNIKALQSNHNIQLANTAEINTKPEFEIYSNDVSCNHGATIGQIDEDVLFYLESRGINKEQGIKILIESFLKSLIVTLDRKQSVISFYLIKLEKHLKNLLLSEFSDQIYP